MLKLFINKIILLITLFINISCLSRSLYPEKERCFYDNYYYNMNIIIRYKILDRDIKLPTSKKNLFKITIEAMNFYDKYQLFYGTKLSGKFAHYIEQSDKYKICIIAMDKDIFQNKKFLYLKFETQIREEKRDEKTAALKDFQVVDETMSRINTKVDNIENMQGYQIKVEDNFSEKQINSTNRLAFLSFCQIFVIVVVGIYHVFYLRRIFKDKIWTPF